MRLALPALAAALLALPAAAQFNGPANLGAAQEINRTPVPTSDRTLLFPSIGDLRLNPGDQIGIRVFGQGDFSPSVRIATDGTVSLPLIGTLSVQGLTIQQAEHLIAEKLVADGIYRDPQVTVTLTEGPDSVVTLIGEVHGSLPVVGSRPLLDVLTRAGGLPASASRIVTINRPGVAEPIVVDLGTDPLRSQAANIPIFPGDTIVVARIGVVYMIGAFKTPGTIALNSYGPLTLMQATALSGGVAFEGQYNDLRIIRTVGDKRTLVKVDVHAILYGKAPDPILQANDIVFLPNNVIKASISNGSLGTILSVAGFILAIAFR